MIPDNITYGAPEICRRTYWRPARWLIDARWRWPETPEPLPATSLYAINAAIWRDIRWYHRHRLGRLRIAREVCELLSMAELYASESAQRTRERMGRHA